MQGRKGCCHFHIFTDLTNFSKSYFSHGRAFEKEAYLHFFLFFDNIKTGLYKIISLLAPCTLGTNRMKRLLGN